MSFPIKTSVDLTAGQRNAPTFLQPPYVLDRETTSAVQHVELLVREGASSSPTQALERLSLEETRELIDAGYLDAASDAAKFLITWEQSLVYKEIAEAWIKQGNLVEATKAAQSIPSISIQTFIYKEIEKGKLDPLMLDETDDSARFSRTQGTTEPREFFWDGYKSESDSDQF